MTTPENAGPSPDLVIEPGNLPTTFQDVLTEILQQEELGEYAPELGRAHPQLQDVEEAVFKATNGPWKDKADPELLAILAEHLPGEEIQKGLYFGVLATLVALKRSLK